MLPRDNRARLVAEFVRFAEQTGYKTLAERPPEPGDYPDADPSLLVAGSPVYGRIGESAADGPEEQLALRVSRDS